MQRALSFEAAGSSHLTQLVSTFVTNYLTTFFLFPLAAPRMGLERFKSGYPAG